MTDSTADITRIQSALGPSIEVRRVLGRGGFATVYEAFDSRLKRMLAIKVLHEELDTAHYRERFRREVEMVAQLRHPHIVPIYDVGHADGVTWFSMPLIPGASVRARLEQGPIPPEQLRRMLMQVASALHAAHEAGMVHRDIKPDNILIDETSGDALLTDFGVAKSLAAEGPSLTSTGLMVGTPHYMSPEQLAADAPLDARTDVYSLGVVAYQCLAGALPFDAAALPLLISKVLSEDPVPLAWRRPDCPASLADAVMRCLAKAPDERWPSAEAFRAALEPNAVVAPTVGSVPRRARRADDDEVRVQQTLAAAHALRRVLVTYTALLAAAVAVEVILGGVMFSPIVMLVGAGHVASILSNASVFGAGWRDVWDAMRGTVRSVPVDSSDASATRASAASQRLLEALRTERRILGALLHRLPRNELARAPGITDVMGSVVTEAAAAVDRVESMEARLASMRAQRRSSAGAMRVGWEEPLARTEEATVAETIRAERDQLLRNLERCADSLHALRVRVQERGMGDCGLALSAVSSAARDLRSGDALRSARV